MRKNMMKGCYACVPKLSVQEAQKRGADVLRCRGYLCIFALVQGIQSKERELWGLIVIKDIGEHCRKQEAL